MHNRTKNKIIFRLLKLIERVAARWQGRGYGSATITQEIKSIASLLIERPISALDIGGNVGNYTAELLMKWPGIVVHIFEPSPVNLEKLRERFGNNPHVTIHPYAVSDFEGESVLFGDEPGSGMGSLSHRDLTHLGISNFDKQAEVKVIKLHDYWKKINGGRIDIVKLDIEGHELAAIKGMGELINNIRILQFEFGGCNIDTRTYFKDFFLFFKSHQFELYRITPLGVEWIPAYRETDEFYSTTNYLALNSAR